MQREAGAKFRAFFQCDIGNDRAPGSCPRRVAREAFDAVLVDRVVVGEQQDGRRSVCIRIANELQDVTDPHARGERANPGSRYRRSIGERVAVGNPQFDRGCAALAECTNEERRRFQIRIAGHEIGDEGEFAVFEDAGPLGASFNKPRSLDGLTMTGNLMT